MKKSLYAILPVLLLATVSCSRAGEIDDGAPVTVTASTPMQAKTWLDTESGGSPIAVYWSNGDAINVNGQKSAGIEVPEGAKISTAEFSLRNARAPFSVIYPASVVSGSSYSGGSIEVTLPSEQAYSPTSFGNGAAVLLGYAQNEQDRVHLKNACAAISVQIKATESMAVESVSLLSNSAAAPLCGVFSVYPQLGEMVPKKGQTQVSLDIKEAVSIESGATSCFYLTVPAGEYPAGFSFSFVRSSDRRPMRCNWTPSAKLEAGHLYCFENVEFVPGVRYIESADDWNEFALAMNSGEGIEAWVEGDSLVRMTNGFDVREDLTQVNEFPYALECNGVTLSRKDATKALFGKISGSVRNLNLSGSGSAPALADTLAGGKLANCNTSVEVKIKTDRDLVFGTLVSESTDGKLIGCTNSGIVKIEQDGTAADLVCNVGGLVGHVSEAASFDFCVNKGNITVSMDNANHYIYNASFGGVAAFADRNYSSGDPIPEVRFNNCSNTGNIWISNTSEAKIFSVCLGGILGRAWGSESRVKLGNPEKFKEKVSFNTCSNTGNLNNGVISGVASQSFNAKSFTGGIVGAVNNVSPDESACTFISCISSGNVIPYDYAGEGQLARPGLCCVCGGFVGGGANLTFKDCKVTSSLGSNKRLSFAISAGIGIATGQFGFDGCTFLPSAIVMPRCYITAQNNWSLVAGYPKDSGTATLSVFAFEKSSEEVIIPMPSIAGSYVRNCSLGCKSLMLNTQTVPYNSTTAACVSVGTKFNNLTNTELFSVQGNMKGSSTTDIKIYCGKSSGDVAFENNTWSNK